jgi:lipoyl(octanoyl) transferase
MCNKVYFQELGSKDYKECWDYQEQLHKEITNIKLQNRDLPQCEQLDPMNQLLFVEHPHVYTLGKSGDEQNMLMNAIQMQAKDATFYKIDRGGDITYHGPGQLVAYPILDLELFNLGVKAYVEKLEEVIINTIAHYGLEGHRLKGATGVWLDPDVPGKTRKICAIGIKVSRYISMHGFAFNINSDLNYFNYINPCGFVDKGVTSLQKELGKEMDMEEVKARVKQEFEKVFPMQLI